MKREDTRLEVQSIKFAVQSLFAPRKPGKRIKIEPKPKEVKQNG